MKSTLAILGSATLAAASCSSSWSGTFEIQATKIASKRSVTKRAALELTLADGVLKDSLGRVGYIASNYQFQFDYQPQPNAQKTPAFAVCDGALALGSSTTFYECRSGTFYNLYDESWAAQCMPIQLVVYGSGGSAGVTQVGDGQPQASSAVAPVSQINDGQPQATSAVAPVSQIGDGQPQASSAVAPVSQIGDGQPQATSAVAPVSQISDGQPQATSAVAPVSQISDGQPQATSAVAPVSQISDGQPQASSAVAPVSQISDGQPQAPTGSNTTVPAKTSSPVTVPTASANKALPGTVGALFLAGLAAVLYL